MENHNILGFCLASIGTRLVGKRQYRRSLSCGGHFGPHGSNPGLKICDLHKQDLSRTSHNTHNKRRQKEPEEKGIEKRACGDRKSGVMRMDVSTRQVRPCH